ncbi:hypothetical protein ACFL4T_07750 [candidate division KSB1 bacterium]
MKKIISIILIITFIFSIYSPCEIFASDKKPDGKKSLKTEKQRKPSIKTPVLSPKKSGGKTLLYVIGGGVVISVAALAGGKKESASDKGRLVITTVWPN